MDSKQDIIQILLEIVCALEIPQRRIQIPPGRLKRLGEAKLADHNVRHRREQHRRDVLEEAAHASRRAEEPAHIRVRGGADGEAVRGCGHGARAVGKRRVRAVGDAGVEAAGDFEGEERRVRVDGVEVAGALDEVFFFLGEGREEVA